MQCIELEARPGVIEGARKKAKKSKKAYKKKMAFKKAGNYRFGITGDFKPDNIIPDKFTIKKAWLKIPRFDGAHIDCTDDGFDIVVSFK